MLARWVCSSRSSTNVPAGRRAALDAECQDRAVPARQAPLATRGTGALGETRVGHPADLVARGEELGDRLGVARVALDAQAQRLEALEEQERVEGRQRRTDVRAARPGPWRCRRRDRARPTRRPRGSRGRAWSSPGRRPLAREVELARVDDDRRRSGAVAADELGQRVHRDVGAVIEQAAQMVVATVLSTISGSPLACAASAMRRRRSRHASGWRSTRRTPPGSCRSRARRRGRRDRRRSAPRSRACGSV